MHEKLYSAATETTYQTFFFPYFLFSSSYRHEGQKQAIHPHRGFNHVRQELVFVFFVKVLQGFARGRLSEYRVSILRVHW